MTDDRADLLAEGFESNRTRLRAVAYRMLGSLAEADDAVQEAWLRASRSDTGGADNLGAWLTTIVARVCLNVLRSRRTRREEPMGVHVPDPVISRMDGTNPEDEARHAVPHWPELGPRLSEERMAAGHDPNRRPGHDVTVTSSEV
ncbi:sigma factor [Nonomuraea sp. 3N208]|uniref:sigma factor n=1 Tax=Nonomuraea sp. 3N208 TaxID=3457421 RepID=UPI003FD0C9C3